MRCRLGRNGGRRRARRPNGERNRLNVAQLETKVDPRAEWDNIFRETWRIQREYFYDPNFHGVPTAFVEDKKRYDLSVILPH